MNIDAFSLFPSFFVVVNKLKQKHSNNKACVWYYYCRSTVTMIIDTSIYITYMDCGWMDEEEEEVVYDKCAYYLCFE
jgi:hypothetical protein